MPANRRVYDYRGYGRSTGWLSERGIYKDVETIWREAQKRDNATPETALLFGHSLGGGPATYLAEKLKVAVLITASSDTGVPDRAALHAMFGLLAAFVWTNFPNRNESAGFAKSARSLSVRAMTTRCHSRFRSNSVTPIKEPTASSLPNIPAPVTPVSSAKFQRLPTHSWRSAIRGRRSTLLGALWLP